MNGKKVAKWAWVILLLALFAVACAKRDSKLVWNEDLPGIGSQSSPRAVDLNRDGVLDIVMGAGKNEFQHSTQGVIAFDGKTGQLLWQQEATDQVYGAATFYDVTSDGVPDVFIGGRSPHFRALDGTNGSVIWAYNHETYAGDSILKHAAYNFNNSVLIPDQNDDALMDVLTVNGGNAEAEPYSEVDRYPGVLMIFDSRTGKILAADTMPDGKESYMSPLCFAQPGSSDYQIIFGTGGETIDGRLYSIPLKDFIIGGLRGAKVLAEERGHGFIAPPSAVDVNADGLLDIVAISHASTVFAIDGRDDHVLWKQKIPNTECSNSFAVGNFTGDDTPDFFTFTSKGEWPNSTGSVQVMLDGSDGKIAYIDSIGCTGFSSPVVYDFDGDGMDEAIISVNEFDCALGFTGTSPGKMENKLIAIDFARRTVQTIDQSTGFKNIFSTPWLGDIDDDGYLDIVHCQYFHNSILTAFLGMRVKRIDLPVRVRKDPSWGGYMGTRGDGVYRP
jgi:outer membrane protein assembly factor BamB